MIIDNTNCNEISNIQIAENLVLSESLSLEDIVNVIYQVQEKNDLNFKLKFNMLSYEMRTSILKYALTHFDVTEYTIIINVINLLKNYNSLSEDFFNDDSILMNSIVEFLDIKTLLENEITIYITELAKCYFSIISSVHKIELNYLDNPHEIEKSFYAIITLLDFYTMSGIVSKAKTFDTCELYLVKDAYMILQYLSDKFKVSNNLLMSFVKDNN